MADERLTLRQAATRLGVSESAIRKRVERGTLRSDKGTDGKRYVYLDTGADDVADTGADMSATHEPDALISELRAHNATLREQLEQANERDRENRRIIAALTSRIPAIEAPSEASVAPVNASATAERRAAAGEAPVGREQAAERSQQPSRWREPVDKLPWWHYALGLIAVFLTTILDYGLGFMLEEILPSVVSLPIIFAVAWFPAGVFGFWVGFRKRDPHLRSEVIRFGLLVGIAVALGPLVYMLLRWGHQSVEGLFAQAPLWFGAAYIAATILAGWLLYVSGALIGNAWQRRRTGHISGTTPASPLSRAGLASPESRVDWTPRKQAMLGFAGTVIAALISLIGTAISVVAGSGG